MIQVVRNPQAVIWRSLRDQFLKLHSPLTSSLESNPWCCVFTHWWHKYSVPTLTGYCNSILALPPAANTDAQVKGSVLCKTLLTSDANCASGCLRLPMLLTDYKFEGSHDRLDNLLELLTELQKVLYLWWQFYYKGYKSEPAKWRDTQDEVWEGPQCKSSIPSPSGIRAFHPLSTWMCSTTRKLHWALVSRVFIGVSLCQHDWLNH